MSFTSLITASLHGQAVWIPTAVPNFGLRRVRAADIPALGEVIASAFNSPTLGTEVAQTLTRYCRNGLDDCSLAEQEDEEMRRVYWTLTNRIDGQPERLCGITGLYYFEWTNPKVHWIGWTALDPGFQSRGLGRAMLTRLMDISRAAGGERLTVETGAHDNATGFYQAMGMVSCATLPQHYGRSLDAHILTCLLSDSDGFTGSTVG